MRVLRTYNYDPRIKRLEDISFVEKCCLLLEGGISERKNSQAGCLPGWGPLTSTLPGLTHVLERFAGPLPSAILRKERAFNRLTGHRPMLRLEQKSFALKEYLV